MAYRLFVIDERGRTVNFTQPDHSRNGKPCLHFPDDKPFTLVLEHDTVTTYIPFDGDGAMGDIEQEEPDLRPVQIPQPEPKKRRHRGRRRQRA